MEWDHLQQPGAHIGVQLAPDGQSFLAGASSEQKREFLAAVAAFKADRRRLANDVAKFKKDGLEASLL